ncbi:FadR/GntR family transcriptional regulator [Dactylosporangium sp. NPDC049742]|uniref:FadR/GntR family transcriptional regulator n=1 Tax=unclassified Dactylosporangium TaxID=2621675 RepID=UPI0034190FB5
MEVGVLSSPQRAVPLATQVAGQFKQLIAAGDWPVGSRIPPEHRLTEQLGVSRNTVREALSALVHLGLLEARPGDGTYVRADSELQVSLGRRVAEADPDDAFEVRALLEHRGSRRAALHATAEDVAHLRELLDRRDAARTGDLAGFVEADFAFHRAVVIAGGNPLLAELYQHLSPVITQTISDSAGLDHDSTVHDLHHHLVDAIEAGDPDAAEACSVALVAEGRDILRGSAS